MGVQATGERANTRGLCSWTRTSDSPATLSLRPWSLGLVLLANTRRGAPREGSAGAEAEAVLVESDSTPEKKVDWSFWAEEEGVEEERERGSARAAQRLTAEVEIWAEAVPMLRTFRARSVPVGADAREAMGALVCVWLCAWHQNSQQEW